MAGHAFDVKPAHGAIYIREARTAPAANGCDSHQEAGGMLHVVEPELYIRDVEYAVNFIA